MLNKGKIKAVPEQQHANTWLILNCCNAKEMDPMISPPNCVCVSVLRILPKELSCLLCIISLITSTSCQQAGRCSSSVICRLHFTSSSLLSRNTNTRLIGDSKVSVCVRVDFVSCDGLGTLFVVPLWHGGSGNLSLFYDSVLF